MGPILDSSLHCACPCSMIALDYMTNNIITSTRLSKKEKEYITTATTTTEAAAAAGPTTTITVAMFEALVEVANMTRKLWKVEK